MTKKKTVFRIRNYTPFHMGAVMNLKTFVWLIWKRRGEKEAKRPSLHVICGSAVMEDRNEPLANLLLKDGNFFIPPLFKFKWAHAT